MQNETKEMVIFLRDDGISLQYPDGQCAGYGIDGNIQVFMGQSCDLFPRKIILHDQRTTNFTRKQSGNES
ncbi:Fur-regulated protein [Citrobacter amalonaticus]|uniref:Fur-regulated protein n=1 Tax=Citrobacter amalonaticus TaxID=35703 RepID=UPI001F46D4B1|nr:Fur-regulated protein [Citrobacter amalonaticus]